MVKASVISNVSFLQEKEDIARLFCKVMVILPPSGLERKLALPANRTVRGFLDTSLTNAFILYCPKGERIQFKREGSIWGTLKVGERVYHIETGDATNPVRYENKNFGSYEKLWDYIQNLIRKD